MAENNVVPALERAEIVAEAKQQALNEIVKRSKAINQLPVTDSYEGKKIELGSGEAIVADTLASGIVENAGPFWEDE